MGRPVLVLAGFVSGLACFGMLAGPRIGPALEVQSAPARAERTPAPGHPVAAAPTATEASPAVRDLRPRTEVASPEAPAPALLPHVAFRELLASGGARRHEPFALEALTRTFTAKDDGSAVPGANTNFLDLDGDARDEGLVVIGDGWWGRHFDLCAFVPTAQGFMLAAHVRFDHATRGTPVVRPLAAPRPGFLGLLCHDGWGTGYQTTCMRIVEAVGANLVEVACIPHSGEIICGGAGPVLEYGCSRVEVAPAARGSALVLVAAYGIDFTTEGFGSEMDTVTVEFEARWAQPAAGAAFRLAHSGGFPAVEQDVFWCLGARAWLARNAEAVRRIARLDEGQLRQVHRTCDLADQCGPCPDAASLRAVIPPLPAR